MALTHAYTTIARLKQMLGIDDSTDDTRLEISLNAASRQIDSHCGRSFWVDSPSPFAPT